MAFIKRHAKVFLVLATIFIASTWYIVNRENDYFTHLNRITKKFIGEMGEKYGFSCFSIGGSLSENIKEISIKFNCYEKKSIEDARALEVNCIERLCEMINSNKKIRSYLEEFPFTNERVSIMICFSKEGFKCFPPEESISLVMSCRENLIYDITFNDQRPYQTVLREPYREAYEKVKGISSDVQQATLQTKYQSQPSKNNKSLSQENKRPIFNDGQQEALARD
ncbi:MAG: hypothetical protein P0S96_04905 [Simkaniaceae bacterium]|nr:hypothetical protein [Candidatus Sacchlamyda saccharinae]